MARSIGVAIDFSDAGFLALRWAAKYLTKWNGGDKLYIIHVKTGGTNPPTLCDDMAFNRIEDLNDIYEHDNWSGVMSVAWDLKNFASAKVYKGRNIPEALRHVSDALQLNTLIVGSAAQEGGRVGTHTGPEVGQYLVQNPPRCSIVIAKEDPRAGRL